MIDGRNLCDQPTKNSLIAYDNKRKIETAKEMITQLIFYWVIPISKIIIRE